MPARTQNDTFWILNLEAKHRPAELHDSGVFAAVEVQLTEEAIFDIVQHVAMNSIRRTLTFQLEYNHTTVMT